MKRKLLLLCVATLLALAATGQTPVRQKPPRGRWGAEVNTYVAPFIDGAISVDGIYNYAVADWFIVGAGAGVLHSATSYSNYTALMYGILRTVGNARICIVRQQRLWFRARMGEKPLRPCGTQYFGGQV